MSYVVRACSAAAEPSWFRCRALSFLSTAYFDDVRTAEPDISRLELVADHHGHIIAIMDVEVGHDLATIDTIAVHPDHQRRGLGRAMLHLPHPQHRVLYLFATSVYSGLFARL
ncbi:GNAT family N-acetyltransferase [Nonomuraea sp. NPDC047897]|uniref:GNAT family N-acetyltransferase n=1 Tax=Nonomuraea sp. NPDC047897 TaxID=3364346 RepID=UPI0037200D77